MEGAASVNETDYKALATTAEERNDYVSGTIHHEKSQSECDHAAISVLPMERLAGDSECNGG